MPGKIERALGGFGTPVTRESQMWGALYNRVVNADDDRGAAFELGYLRREHPGEEGEETIPRVLTSELEAALRSGELGDKITRRLPDSLAKSRRTD